MTQTTPMNRESFAQQEVKAQRSQPPMTLNAQGEWVPVEDEIRKAREEANDSKKDRSQANHQ